MTTPTFSIGRLAKDSGFSIDTIRFYERKRLLPEPERRPSGYRCYRDDTLVRLRFIRRAKDLGFKLEEIAELLTLSEDNNHGVEGVRQRADDHVKRITRRIDELIRVRDSLTQLVDACPGHGAPEDCPILRALTGDQDPLERESGS